MKSEEIKHLIHSLGINATYRGYRYLCYAVELAMKDEDYLLCISKWLYPEIAAKYETTVNGVERNIRTVITVCWERGNRKLLDHISAYPLTSKPSTGEFIDILITYLKQSHRYQTASDSHNISKTLL